MLFPVLLLLGSNQSLPWADSGKQGPPAMGWGLIVHRECHTRQLKRWTGAVMVSGGSGEWGRRMASLDNIARASNKGTWLLRKEVLRRRLAFSSTSGHRPDWSRIRPVYRECWPLLCLGPDENVF